MVAIGNLNTPLLLAATFRLRKKVLVQPNSRVSAAHLVQLELLIKISPRGLCFPREQWTSFAQWAHSPSLFEVKGLKYNFGTKRGLMLKSCIKAKLLSEQRLPKIQFF